jgi:hypothetical protein
MSIVQTSVDSPHLFGYLYPKTSGIQEVTSHVRQRNARENPISTDGCHVRWRFAIGGNLTLQDLRAARQSRLCGVVEDLYKHTLLSIPITILDLDKHMVSCLAIELDVLPAR